MSISYQYLRSFSPVLSSGSMARVMLREYITDLVHTGAFRLR